MPSFYSVKNDLQKLLKTVCIEQKKIEKKGEKNVFIGYKVVTQTVFDEDIRY